MRLSTLLPLLSLASLALATPQPLTLHYAPIHTSPSSSSATPTPLAQISYDPTAQTASLTSYTPPTGSYAPHHLLRLGLWDPASGDWRGSVVASAASFEEGVKQVISLYTDARGEVWRVGFGAASGAGEKAEGGKEEIEVKVVGRQAGPQPALNRPVVLNAEGRVEGKEEKTFLQKYWWVLALILLMQVAGGGGEEKK